VGQRHAAGRADGNDDAGALIVAATTSAAHWLAHAEAEAAKAQQALDDLDSLSLPPQWGEVDVVQQRRELSAACDEYLRDAAHWRGQLI